MGNSIRPAHIALRFLFKVPVLHIIHHNILGSVQATLSGLAAPLRTTVGKTFRALREGVRFPDRSKGLLRVHSGVGMSGKNVRRTCSSAVSMFGGTIRHLFYVSFMIFVLYPLSVIRVLNFLRVPTDSATVEGNRLGRCYPVGAYIHLLPSFKFFKLVLYLWRGCRPCYRHS